MDQRIHSGVGVRAEARHDADWHGDHGADQEAEEDGFDRSPDLIVVAWAACVFDILDFFTFSSPSFFVDFDD